MNADNFIKVADKFVNRTPNKYNIYYKSTYEKQEVEVQGGKGWLSFENQLAILPNAQATALGYIDIYEDVNKGSKSSVHYGGLARLINTIQKFQVVNDSHALADKKEVEALLQDVKILHKKRIAIFLQYGNYGLQTERGVLEPEDITKVNQLFTDVDKYEEFLAMSKKEVKKLKTRFEALIAPFLFEHLKAVQRSHYYGRSNDKSPSVYYPAKGFGPLFPSANLPLATQQLLTQFAFLKEKGENLLESLDSVDNRNAKKDLKGYAIYVNNGRSEGFYTSESTITKNILDAKIFETPVQGRAYASRRSQKDCMVVEISFHFTKILEATNCAAGPSMQTLVATREASDLEELLPMPVIEASTPIPSRRNKI